MRIVARSRLERRKNQQIASRVGSCEHIEVVAVVKAPPVEVPSDIVVKLGVIKCQIKPYWYKRIPINVFGQQMDYYSPC